MGVAATYERLESFVLGLRDAGVLGEEDEADIVDGMMLDAWIDMTPEERAEAQERARRYNEADKSLGYVDVPVEIGSTTLPRRRALPGELLRAERRGLS